MTIKIAHRGNYQGRNPDRENTVSYIKEALDAGYWVEVDVQCHDGHMYFGHDEPQQIVDYGIIRNSRVFCHAKTPEALQHLHMFNAHCFAHDIDYATHTSQGYIWCYPGIHIYSPRAIWLDLHDKPLPDVIPTYIYGICSDNFNNITC